MGRRKHPKPTAKKRTRRNAAPGRLVVVMRDEYRHDVRTNDAGPEWLVATFVHLVEAQEYTRAFGGASPAHRAARDEMLKAAEMRLARPLVDRGSDPPELHLTVETLRRELITAFDAGVRAAR